MPAPRASRYRVWCDDSFAAMSRNEVKDMSFDQLRARRGDVTRFLAHLRAQREMLERAKNGATSVAHRVTIQAELDKIERLIAAAEKELATIDAELERVRAAYAARKGEVRSAAEQAVTELEKRHAALVAALERALEECEKFIRAAREAENRMDEARRLGEILGEPLMPVFKFPGGAHLPVAELRAVIESHLRTIRGWGK